jgi:hypothetical protein
VACTVTVAAVTAVIFVLAGTVIGNTSPEAAFAFEVTSTTIGVPCHVWGHHGTWLRVTM